VRKTCYFFRKAIRVKQNFYHCRNWRMYYWLLNVSHLLHDCIFQSQMVTAIDQKLILQMLWWVKILASWFITIATALTKLIQINDINRKIVFWSWSDIDPGSRVTPNYVINLYLAYNFWCKNLIKIVDSNKNRYFISCLSFMHSKLTIFVYFLRCTLLT